MYRTVVDMEDVRDETGSFARRAIANMDDVERRLDQGKVIDS